MPVATAPTAPTAPAGTETEREAAQLQRAVAHLEAVIAAAKQRTPNRRTSTLTTATVDLPAPYAKEQRLLLGQVAAAQCVMAVGTGTVAATEYRRGASALLLGFAPDVTRTQQRYTVVLAAAVAAMRAATPAAGEDVATYRSSFLLGFRLGLAGTFDQETVTTAVATPEAKASGVWLRSTGSGAWAGYTAGRAFLATPE